jgi:hypothetical protein
MLQIVFVILGCVAIYSYTITLPTTDYCDWTGDPIMNPLGNEVTFLFANGSQKHYCCINISLLAFERLKTTGEISLLENIRVHCPICGMEMDWNDPMIVWIYSENYVNPTTEEPTIVAVCEDAYGEDLCESHFLDEYGGEIVASPYVWPE